MSFLPAHDSASIFGLNGVTPSELATAIITRLSSYTRSANCLSRNLINPTDDCWKRWLTSPTFCLDLSSLIMMSLIFINHHALQDQYRAFQRGPGLAQLCLARNDFLRPGMFFLMRIFLSPKFTLTTLPLGPLT